MREEVRKLAMLFGEASRTSRVSRLREEGLGRVGDETRNLQLRVMGASARDGVWLVLGRLSDGVDVGRGRRDLAGCAVVWDRRCWTEVVTFYHRNHMSSSLGGQSSLRWERVNVLPATGDYS